MSYIQIIEMRTKNFDELHALGDRFFEATEGKRTVRRLLDGPPTFDDLDVVEDWN